MGAVFKKEFMSYLHSVTGWLFMALTICFFAMYSSVYNFTYGTPYIAYAFDAVLIVFFITVPLLSMRVMADERRHRTDQLLKKNGRALKSSSGVIKIAAIARYFPSTIFPTPTDDGIDSQKFILPQKQNCYQQAIQYSDLDTDAIVSALLQAVCSAPGTSSNPQDYLDAHPGDWHELLYYGGYTLSYCLDRFAQGGETGLEGKVMALLCEDLLQTKGKIPLDAATAQTGQFWYETLVAHAGNPLEW